MNIENCFTASGTLKIDPYRRQETDLWLEVYHTLFDEDGYLKDRNKLIVLAAKLEASYTSDVVGLYHADIHAGSTKGSYPTIYYFR